MRKPEQSVDAAPLLVIIGARLREERERMRLTQASLGSAGGVGKTTQYLYERGCRQPDVKYLTAVAQLGVDTTYIMTGTRQGSPEAARMNAADQIVDGVLAIGTRRSAEYRRGMLDVLRFRLDGTSIQCPYREGTSQFDAYFAGNDRGHTVWHALQQTERPA